MKQDDRTRGSRVQSPTSRPTRGSMPRSWGGLKYELLLLLTSVIWGAAFVAQQIGMERGLGPMTFNGLRFALGCLSLLPVLLWRRRRRDVAAGPAKLPIAGSALAGLFLFAAASLQQIGLQYTSSANAGFITGFYILFVPVLGLLSGHRARVSLWVGIVVSLVGLYLLSVTGNYIVSKGDVLILIGSALWACQILAIDRVASDGDPILISLLQFAVCAVLSLLTAVVFEHWTLGAVKAGAGALAYAGIMSVGVAYTLQVVGQKFCPPAPAAIIMSLEAVFAAIAGYLVLHQTLTDRAVIGCFLILSGVLIVQLVPMLRRKSPVVEESRSSTIDAVFFAQTHVLQPAAPFFKLVGNKETLIKVHVLSPSGAAAPPVEAELCLDGETERLPLDGPAVLPKEICTEPGKVVHRYDDSFTAMIPARWIKRGLEVTIHAGDLVHRVDVLEIGPPLVLNMTMFDIHYFAYEDVDYPEGWEEEIAVRRPISALNVQRLRKIVFPELIIPPVNGHPAVHCTCTDDYKTKTGESFNGQQDAATQWYDALQKAGGMRRLAAYYISIANVHSGGWAWDFAGMGSLRRFPVLNHELGHVLYVDDLPCEGGYPYRGPMFGINKDNGAYHGGPTWRFDQRTGFISPILSKNAERGTPGEWRKDPMGGGGIAEEPGEAIAGFSDYSVRKMQEYMERHLAIWCEEKQAYLCWNHYTGAFSTVLKNDGISFPIERDVEVYSIMASASAVTEEANFIYEVIGPYRSGLIDTFDPQVEEGRARARKLNVGRWDISLRIHQGGVTRTFMLPAAWRPDDDPLDSDSLQTRAVNVPVRDGKVTRAELLLTPEADVHGLPSTPRVLYSRVCT